MRPVESPPLGDGRLHGVLLIFPLVAVATRASTACSTAILADMRQCALGPPALPLSSSVARRRVTRGGIPVGSRNASSYTIDTTARINVTSGPTETVIGGVALPAGGGTLSRHAPWGSASFITRIKLGRTVGIQPARLFGHRGKDGIRWSPPSVSALHTVSWTKLRTGCSFSRCLLLRRARRHGATMHPLLLLARPLGLHRHVLRLANQCSVAVSALVSSAGCTCD